MAELRPDPRVHSPALLQEIAGLVRELRNSAGEDAVRVLGSHGIQALRGGRNNPVFVARSIDPPVCVKLHKVDGRNRAEREWEALGFLDRIAPGLAPLPLAFFPDETCPVMFMEFVEGEPLDSDSNLDDRALAALATATRRLHAIESDKCPFPYEATATSLSMLELVNWLMSQMALLPSSHDLRPLIDPIERWLKSSEPQRLTRAIPPGFSRGDANLANCLFDGECIQFVDLEYAGWKDPVLDLAGLIEGVWARSTLDESWREFIERFDLSDEERARFVAARQLCSLHWIYLLWRKSDFDATISPDLRQQIKRALTLLA